MGAAASYARLFTSALKLSILDASALMHQMFRWNGVAPITLITCTCQSDAMLLATREVDALLPNLGTVPSGQHGQVLAERACLQRRIVPACGLNQH